jgi:hypothetical protein
MALSESDGVAIEDIRHYFYHHIQDNFDYDTARA